MRKQLIKTLLLIIACLVVLSFLLLINLPINCEGSCAFTIAKGENLKIVADRLESEGYISSSVLFQMYFKIKGQERNIKAGDYQFSPPLTIKTIYEAITNGKSAQNNNFLITEGETLLEIEENLKAKNLIDKFSSLKKWQLKDFFDLFGVNEFQIISFSVFSKLPEDAPLEGFLFPDSYHLPKGMEEKEILSIFINNFVSKISGNLIWEIENNLFLKVNGEKRTFYEVLTMASLLEKEVLEKEDKQIVSDILWRRLDNNFPLQVDATICYAQFESFKKCSLSRDLFKIDSPYNTYLYKGLPPTPINNPGLESIQAALTPKANNYWYYLTDWKTGNTIFSETYED
ncbi:MAG: endolytic transglycosylase MltG, partial [Candidatus Pacebacteria bacterium]|nr:endolytic transglycosylase MltG [Candidatus Paceibacterota bacterium]